MSPLEGLATVSWNLGIPTLAVLWLGLARDPRRTVVAIDAVLAILVSAAVFLTALWLAIPRWLILLPVAAIVPAALYRRSRGSRRSRDPKDPDRRAVRIAATAARAGLLGVAGVVVFGALAGRAPPPGEPVDLASPLPDGVWLVANGGSTGAVNAHLRTLDDPATSEWRGQSYAVDLVGAGAWGSRTRPTPTPALSEFEIFRHPVVAPCAGRVIRVRDDEPERPTGSAPWRTRPGNHVVLECGGAWVLLAHFTPGSTVVEVGDRVEVGDPVARVGNTGASGEPHLHVHAQTPGTPEAPFAGRPLPVRIDGRGLVRNDRLHSDGAPTGAPQLPEASR